MIEPRYQSERVSLYCADCLQVLPQLEAGSVDLTVTSPPYDNLRTYNGYAGAFKFEPIAQELYRITKPGGVIVWVVGDETIKGSESGSSFTQALYFKELGFNLHDTMIYEKNGPVHPDATRYHQVFEFMFIFSKGRPNTINLITDRKNRWGGYDNFGTRSNRSKLGDITSSTLANRKVKDYGVRFNIWKINGGYGYTSSDEIAYNHPAVFPEELARDHILSWSNQDSLIFDPMMGSGTTGKMAIKYQRQFIGCDIVPDYYAIAEKRIRAAEAQLTMF